MSMLSILLLAFLGLLFAAFLLLLFMPGTIVKVIQWVAARRAGLVGRAMIVGGYQTHYYEGGSGPVVLLLHGLGDDRNTFVASAARFSDRYRVILLDLQGHGSNAQDRNRDYSIRGQVEFVLAFVQTMGLSSFVIGGNSMGGHVSTAFCIRYPQLVNGLIIVNGAGLVPDEHEVYAGHDKKIESRQDFFELFDRVVHNRPDLPGPVINFMIARMNDSFDFTNFMAASIREGEDHSLNGLMDKVQVPTLILWGRHDEVVRFNVAEGFAAEIPNATLTILENASHSPQFEMGPELGSLMRKFLNTISG